MDERAGPDTRRLRRLLAVTDLPCPRCGYSLLGSRGEVCPECGLALTFEMFTIRPAAVTRAYRAAQGGALMAAVVGLARLAIDAPRHLAHGEWGRVGAAGAVAVIGAAAAVAWMALRGRIRDWPRHRQARAASVVWAVVVVVLLVSIAG